MCTPRPALCWLTRYQFSLAVKMLNPGALMVWRLTGISIRINVVPGFIALRTAWRKDSRLRNGLRDPLA